MIKEPATNLRFNVDQDKRESVILNVKPAQLILDSLQMVNHALDAQPIKLFHHSVSAQPAQLDKKLMLLEMAVMLLRFHVDQDKEESHGLNAKSVIFTPEFLMMADHALVAVLV